jgi:hypothetical protein
MTIDRVFKTALVVAGATALATWFGVRPLHLRAADLEQDVESLHERIAVSSVPEARLAAAQRERDHRRELLRREGFDRMPDGSPDLAGVIRRLSLPIDHVRVLDQTFTAGRSGTAGNGAPDGWFATPIRVELDGDWSAVRELLDVVDGLDVPVRTTRLQLKRSEVDGGVAARLELDLDVLHRSAVIAEEGRTP